jgi:hypothetical protein
MEGANIKMDLEGSSSEDFKCLVEGNKINLLYDELKRLVP